MTRGLLFHLRSLVAFKRKILYLGLYSFNGKMYTILNYIPMLSNSNVNSLNLTECNEPEAWIVIHE